jgi:Mitochondrial ATP synthase epsilon chain
VNAQPPFTRFVLAAFISFSSSFRLQTEQTSPTKMSQAVNAAKKVATTSYWRAAGLTYLDQLNIATTSLRKVLKEPLRSESLGKAQYRFREFNYADGKELAPGE